MKRRDFLSFLAALPFVSKPLEALAAQRRHPVPFSDGAWLLEIQLDGKSITRKCTELSVLSLRLTEAQAIATARKQ